jgi:cell division protein FtsW
MQANFTSRFKGDRWIWLVVIILSLLGILAVYSATGTLAYSKRGGNTELDRKSVV